MTTPILQVIPWNGSGLELSPEIAVQVGIPPDFFTSSGEIIYGMDNTFAIDIKFKSSVPGFVVQEIKKQIYDDDNKTIVEEAHYWEIFYISPNQKRVNPDGSVYYLSENADSFKYGTQKDDALIKKGYYIQTGDSEFYPYDNSDGSVQFRNGIMLSSPQLVNFFGDSVEFENPNTLANGLPYSSTKINVSGLSISGPILTRLVGATWNHHEDKDIELEEKFYYSDVPEDAPNKYWQLTRLDFQKDISESDRIALANKLRKYVYKNDKLFIKSKAKIDITLADELLDYLTTAQFGEENNDKGGNKKYKKGTNKKNTKKSKKKYKRAKSRKKMV